MSGNSDAFARQVLGAKADLGFAAGLAYLRQTAGSGRGAARLAGVGEASLRDYAKGRYKPSTATQEKIAAAVRDLRTPRPTEDDRVSLKVTSTEPRRRGGTRERIIKAGALKLAPGTMEKARAAYVTGGSEAAMKKFVAGVQEPFYKQALTPPEWADNDSFESDYSMTF